MLVVEDLTRQYSGRRAVDGVSLKIERGSFVGVIGRSGAGKSTLLRLINRLADPSSGRILYDGRDVTGLTGRPLREWRTRCAMIFQQFNLVGRLDVMTNVLMGRLSHVPTHRALLRMWSDEDRAMALAALESFDMGEFAGQRADGLSGGQQQRVAIARALVQEPEILLADEPVASLDPRNTRLVMDALAAVNRRYGITVLCNLHSLDLARAYCDRLVGHAAGRVVFEGGPFDLTEDVARRLYGLEAGEVLDDSAAREAEQRAAMPGLPGLVPAQPIREAAIGA
ncbi:phosphonate ABC transporter ATP-binding protein [Methylobacterium sp. GXS13]|uniref:phosphonate ABC transporter ATP-binding protein n=1 Tax=Methylobacterium sp. GXS13 TaxID=1730094 RepID=UPI00071BE193|nr:phosphonate ABC transporter ATP-binding protein [Methylobacterium sp. GXS13]KST59858.1 phosphonate ABC transporter ATP-binding protein [Methylobacterium sp. GXS13]